MGKAKVRSISDDEWQGAAAMAWHGNRLYVMHGESLCEVDPAARTYKRVGDARWEPRFLASDGKSLYAIEADGGLYRVNARDGNSDRLSDGWDVRAVAVVDGKLYAAGDEVFLAQDLATGKQVPLDLRVPEMGVTVMAGEAGVLYAHTGDSIIAVHGRGANGEIIHEGGIPDARTLVSCNGKLYVGTGTVHQEIAIPPKGKKSKPTQVELEGVGDRWDTVMATSSRDKIYALEASGELFEISPR